MMQLLPEWKEAAILLLLCIMSGYLFGRIMLYYLYLSPPILAVCVFVIGNSMSMVMGIALALTSREFQPITPLVSLVLWMCFSTAMAVGAYHQLKDQTLQRVMEARTVLHRATVPRPPIDADLSDITAHQRDDTW